MAGPNKTFGSTTPTEDSPKFASRDEILASLVPVIADQLNRDAEEVVESASIIDDLKADSLDIVELVMALEEHLKVDIHDEDAEKLKTIGDAVSYVARIYGLE